ncbi:MAG: MerR family transcriptional regulator [Pseudomonadota bacterium]
MDDSAANRTMGIRELVKRTGLTSRALRFYEARGLLTPLRSYNGQRYYGPRELERVHRIVVLKSAGLSLSQMKDLFDGQMVDLDGLLHAQLEMLEEEAQQIDRTRSVIHFALSRIARSEPLDAATFCSLIESGDKMMNQEPKEWKQVTDRYFSPEAKAEWAQTWGDMPEGFDQEAYARQWQALGDKIKAALPLKPESEQAQRFVDEWFALLKPFTDIASPEMMAGTTRMYDDMDQWAGTGEGQADPGFDKEVWEFMKLASAVRMSRNADGPQCPAKTPQQK